MQSGNIPVTDVGLVHPNQGRTKERGCDAATEARRRRVPLVMTGCGWDDDEVTSNKL